MMVKEFETKVLDIRVNSVKRDLRRLGALQKPPALLRRWVFDINPAKDEWLRLRDDGEKITLTYKCKSGSGISETEEIEVKVDSFETTAILLSKLKFRDKYYQENNRITYQLANITFTLDSWPKIPPYLEIEGPSEKAVRQGLSWLGLEGKDVGNLSVKKVFLRYGIDLHSFKELKF